MPEIVPAPPIKHFMNSIGITPAVYSPLAYKIVKKEVFTPGPVAQTLPMPKRPRDFGSEQLGATLGFPFKKPDSLNLALAEKYDVRDEKQRSMAAAELKMIAEAQAKAVKFQKDKQKYNLFAALRAQREAAAKEKVEQYKDWEKAAFPDDPMTASIKAQSDASTIARLEDLYENKLRQEELELRRALANFPASVRRARSVEPERRPPPITPFSLMSSGTATPAPPKRLRILGLPDDITGGMKMINTRKQLDEYIATLNPADKARFMQKGDVKAAMMMR